MIEEDDRLEDDEEETLVYVEVEGVTGNHTFSDKKLQLDMFGLDSEHPIMRINGRYFEGSYEEAVGTYMFFDKENNPIIKDKVFDKAPSLKYQTKTRKVLKFKRVFVKQRLDVLGDSDHPSCVPNKETIIEAGVPPKYQDEALSLWDEMRKERLEAMNEYLEKQKQRKEKRQQGIEPDSESDDDNPFAIYKNNTEIMKDCQQLTVIDPGPSTSKEHVESSEINSEITEESTLPKNQGHIEVFSNKKPRNNGKKRSKKSDEVLSAEKNEEMDIQEPPISDVESDRVVPEEGTILEERTISIESGKSEDASSEIIEAITEDIDFQTSESEVLEELTVNDKKLEKQMKREAKMQEISERLKKTANELKSKSTIDKSEK